MGNKLPTPPLHSTHDENAASDSSVATDSDDASNGSDEVDLEAEGEEADLLTNGPAYYNMFLDLEEEECVKPKMKKRRGAKGVVYYRNEQGQLVVMPHATHQVRLVLECSSIATLNLAAQPCSRSMCWLPLLWSMQTSKETSTRWLFLQELLDLWMPLMCYVIR
ncbi:hypothetical protein IV203_015930 [Nitzschia inconspicua]|uniref:Uncharacterized protein n=1 Tax=Nitzschia inconspicua TaxID=303405 RepID=A0A9K3K3Q6_9STRA|nr:hypothetical protein IV203_025043 [Nitzschia inconspicua]KAG7359341.1 hypothetical protein IV203_015930 [Nitzschia inconspicua]